MSKKNKSKKKEAPVEEVVEEPSGPTISIGELNGITRALQSEAMAIHLMGPEEQRTLLLNESWELTRLQVKHIARSAKQQINDKLMEFFRQFPEAVEPLKAQITEQNEEE